MFYNFCLICTYRRGGGWLNVKQEQIAHRFIYFCDVFYFVLYYILLRRNKNITNF